MAAALVVMARVYFWGSLCRVAWRERPAATAPATATTIARSAREASVDDAATSRGGASHRKRERLGTESDETFNSGSAAARKETKKKENKNEREKKIRKQKRGDEQTSRKTGAVERSSKPTPERPCYERTIDSIALRKKQK